jgi:glycosyltransferase involved in cell wall biosynthesis
MIARVLHIVPNLVPYGLERMVGTLAVKTNRQRFEVSVASLFAEQPGSLAASVEAQGIKVFHLGKRRGLDVRMFWRIHKLLVELRPDIVHTHNYVLRYTLPATLRHRTPIVVHTIHNVADHEVDRLGVWLQRFAFRLGGVHPVVIAEAAAASFERVYRMPRPSLIMNGIDVTRHAVPATGRETWRRREGFHSDDLLFVCVARLDLQKNHRDLLQAFAAGLAQLTNCRLLLAGDGYLRSELERRARDLGISGQVHFLGRREDVPELLAACDVFVLASLWEGNPLSVMEAMAAGLPVVATSAGGVPELVDSGTHGIIVPSGELPALARALVRMANDRSLRQSMGAAAAAHARNRFDDRRMVEAYESLYNQFLSSVPLRSASVPMGGY